jgi:hypothetical protein
MSKGDSQEGGMVSLEEKILRRYAQKSEKSSSEAEPSSAAGVEGKETVSLEDVILGEDATSDGPEERKALEEDILERYTSEDPEFVEALEPVEEPSSDRDKVMIPGEDLEIDAPVVERPASAMEPGRGPPAMPASPEEVVETLRRLREDVGQISELSAEEENIVAAFALAFLKLMDPLTKALPVDVSVLPRKLGLVERANVVPKGDLVLLYMDSRMESIDLTERDNRDLLITVVSDVMPRFNNIIFQRRNKIEKRITFLSSVTKELQTIADSIEFIG